jgi:mannose-1-phosphate guanylyltransferase
MTMLTFHTAVPESCGIVELDEHGVVKAFHEKVKDPPGNLANGAVYILEPGIFSFLEKLRKEVIDFSTEVLPHYMGRIYTFHNNVYLRDIGTMESYLRAIEEFGQFAGKI